jgi:hypothetical protein
MPGFTRTLEGGASPQVKRYWAIQRARALMRRALDRRDLAMAEEVYRTVLRPLERAFEAAGGQERLEAERAVARVRLEREMREAAREIVAAEEAPPSSTPRPPRTDHDRRGRFTRGNRARRPARRRRSSTSTTSPEDADQPPPAARPCLCDRPLWQRDWFGGRRCHKCGHEGWWAA